MLSHKSWAFLAVFSAVVLCAAPEATASNILKRGCTAARKRIDNFRKRVCQLPVTPKKGLGGLIASTTLAVARDGGEKIILRTPKSASHKVAKNNSQLILATQMGVPELVPPAFVAEHKSQIQQPGKESMVMEYVGSKYKQADTAPKAWHRKVPEDKRVYAAVIDLLSEHRDRRMRNVMVSKGGSLRLIDPDTTYGQGNNHNKPRAMYASSFFPGGYIGFKAKNYKSFSDLPKEIQDVVTGIHQASTQEVAKIYGIKTKYAELKKARAKSIVEKGLVKAIEKFVDDIKATGKLAHAKNPHNPAKYPAEGIRLDRIEFAE